MRFSTRNLRYQESEYLSRGYCGPFLYHSKERCFTRGVDFPRAIWGCIEVGRWWGRLLWGDWLLIKLAFGEVRLVEFWFGYLRRCLLTFAKLWSGRMILTRLGFVYLLVRSSPAPWPLPFALCSSPPALVPTRWGAFESQVPFEEALLHGYNVKRRDGLFESRRRQIDGSRKSWLRFALHEGSSKHLLPLHRLLEFPILQ